MPLNFHTFYNLASSLPPQLEYFRFQHRFQLHPKVKQLAKITLSNKEIYSDKVTTYNSMIMNEQKFQC